MDIYLARQPIFDRKQRVFGYEVLYRGELQNYFPLEVDGELATSTVLAHTLMNIGLERVAGGKKALINFTAQHLLDGTPLQMPHETCIVEILENIPPTKEILTACEQLKQRGYTLALDDYCFEEIQEPFLQWVDVVKVDMRACSPDRLQTNISHIAKDRHQSMLAEKIEQQDEYARCREMGFHYFQGYFFSKPEVIHKQKLDITQVTLLAMMAEVTRPDFSFSRAEKMISSDVSLSFKLLRYINSAYYSLVSKVKSIRHALAYLGEKGTRQFVCLVVASELAVNKTPELTRLAIIRGQLCKLLALQCRAGYDESEVFLLGLFSLLDAMLDRQMEEVLHQLPLDESLYNALVQRTGPLAPFLLTVEAYEKGDLQTCMHHLSRLNISSEAMVSSYFQALQWADLFNEE